MSAADGGATTRSPKLPAIEPMPPVADCAMPWDTEVDDTVATISTAREACGDTFVVDSGRDRYLFWAP